MEIVTLEEFIADIETTFANYAATGDIDRNSIKGWVIECLRRFGKNICDKRETIVEIKNSRALLPETFKSLILALKLSPEENNEKKDNKRLIVEKKRIENPAYFSDVTLDYYIDNCTSKIVTEKIYTHYEYEGRCYNSEWLSLVKGFTGDSIDSKCLNLNPIIRDAFPNKISITNRMLSTNFKEGMIYMQYNSLPTDEETGEIAVPILSTGSIELYIKNYVKIRIAEMLGINDKNPQTLKEWAGLWIQQDRQLFIEAKSEANWANLNPNWSKKYYNKNRQNADRYNLPK